MSINITNLKKQFGGNKVLAGTTLKLKSGKVNLLMGNNGSGKSTLVNCMTGFTGPDGGQVFYKDGDITGLPMHQVFASGVIRTFQTPRLFANLSVFENIMLAKAGPGESFVRALFYGRWQDFESSQAERAHEILTQLNLIQLKNSLAYDLSGGQIKLLEIGKALMSGAGTIILDEPIAGVNPKLAHQIFQKIKEMSARGTTFLIIEHRLDIALEYADYAFVMDSGAIIADGAAKDILGHESVIKAYLT